MLGLLANLLERIILAIAINNITVMFSAQSVIGWQGTALAMALPPQSKDTTPDPDTTIESRPLTKRAPIEDCPLYYLDTFPQCPYNSEEAIKSWLYPIALKIKDLSNQKKCDMSCGETNDFKWCFESRTEGKNCDITAQVATIQDAINKALARRGYWIYSKACFRLNHGETWRGSLNIGLKTWDDTLYC